MTADIHRYGNGIEVFREDLTGLQLDRYASNGSGLHEPVEEYWFESVLDGIEAASNEKSPIFVDGGAALGYYSMLFKRRFAGAAVHAVEALPSMRERFRATVALNGFAPDAFTLVPFALYPHGESVVFNDSHFGSYICQGVQEVVTEQQSRLPTIDLPAVLERCGGRADLIKLDIQAAELALINCNSEILASGRVRHWIVGTHSPAIHAALLDRFSQQHDILFEDGSPEGQPDGLIVARHSAQTGTDT